MEIDEMANREPFKIKEIIVVNKNDNNMLIVFKNYCVYLTLFFEQFFMKN